MLGKKGAARFRYTNREVKQSYTQFEDQSTYAQAEEAITPIIDRYARGEIDAVTLVFTRYESSSRQSPIVLQLLPIPDQPTGDEEGGPKHSGGIDFIFEPSPGAILDTLLPLSLKTQFFQAILEAATSEQIARRVAMKNATDNADEMSTKYTQQYNRTRQASITQEILEVIGGAESVS